MAKALILLLLSASPALAQSNPELERANRLLFDQKYGDASKALEAAAKVQGNGREAVLRIYELQGIVYGQLGQATKARESFQSLLSLDPKRALVGKQSPKVNAAFNAAKEWASFNPPLEFKAAKAAIDENGKVMQLAAKVRNDSMKLVRKVRFHLRLDEGKWTHQDSELQGAYAAANTDAAGVEWWAELLGDNERVLMLAGSQSAPVREGKVKDRPSAVVVADAPKKDEQEKEKEQSASKVQPDEPAAEAAPEVSREAIVEESSGGSSPLRPIGYALMGAGLVGVGVGAFFGVQSSSTRGRITNAAKDSAGLVTGITQKEAMETLEPQAKSQAVLANVLFGVGGGVALTGGVLWLAGGLSSSSASVSIAPTLGGAVVSGSF